jgi:two-component system CheB/CheR fusion protein
MAPISNIEGLINLIKAKLEKKPDIKEIAGMIDSAIAKFKAVIKDLGEIGRIESEMQKDRDKVNFGELINDIRLTILDRVTTTNTKIYCDFQVEEINFAKKNLRSIFYNLISNSIKYKSQDREPEITVRTEAMRGFVMLSFSDNGMGIVPDKIDSIFTLYSRLGQQVDGQGIGLYLVKKIIDASGGKVEVESEFGKGTTFKIFFKM